MLNRIKSLFRGRTPPEEHFHRQITARFDAAQTTRDNARHWAMADYMSADQEAKPEVRRVLRQRSRYEIANNSYAKGLVQMLANDTIGTGPRLQVLTEDEKYNDAVETDFALWDEAVKLPQKLRLMRIARCQDGEAFAVLATNPKVRHPVKMDIQLVEADRISGELRWNEDENSVDGITYDQWGNPVDYRILNRRKMKMQSEFTLIEAASGGKPKVIGTAYSGGKMKLPGWKYPVVVDLAGMEIPEAVPLLANHENKTGSRVAW